jgi:hypothetical protein
MFWQSLAFKIYILKYYDENWAPENCRAKCSAIIQIKIEGHAVKFFYNKTIFCLFRVFCWTHTVFGIDCPPSTFLEKDNFSSFLNILSEMTMKSSLKFFFGNWLKKVKIISATAQIGWPSFWAVAIVSEK